jgi:hypothetical protein
MTWNSQQNPFQSGSQFPQPNQVPGPTSQSAHDKLKGPGISLMVVGGIGLVTMGVVLVLTIANLFVQPDVMAGVEDLEGPAKVGYYVGFFGPLIGMALNVVFQTVVMAGGYSMIRGKSRGLCLTACVVSLIPCISGCCIVGIPFGIWGLVVLSDENVKRVFK